MAKTNKYSPINFNHIYDKNLSSNSKSGNNPTKNPSPRSPSFAAATYSSVSSPHKAHGGRMLVLTRPTPKPISPLPPAAVQARPQPDSDAISLRPLGRTGAGAIGPIPTPEKEKEGPPAVAVHKPEKFVPPHLRAGFVGKEERPVSAGVRSREGNQRPYGGYGRYGEDGRPKSGGEADLGATVNRPRSGGNRPSSSG